MVTMFGLTPFIIDKNECLFELKPRTLLWRIDHLLSLLEKLHDFFADFLLLRRVCFFLFSFLGTCPVTPTVAVASPDPRLACVRAVLWRAGQRSAVVARYGLAGKLLCHSLAYRLVWLTLAGKLYSLIRPICVRRLILPTLSRIVSRLQLFC